MPHREPRLLAPIRRLGLGAPPENVEQADRVLAEAAIRGIGQPVMGLLKRQFPELDVARALRSTRQPFVRALARSRQLQPGIPEERRRELLARRGLRPETGQVGGAAGGAIVEHRELHDMFDEVLR